VTALLIFKPEKEIAMAGYFSFQKMISTPLIKTVYFLGFIALTIAGIGLAVWAGMGLQSATLPTRVAINYIAIGAGILIVGNLAWRVICETWVLFFNIHGLLTSIDQGVRHNSNLSETEQENIHQEAKPEKLSKERKSPSVQPEKNRYDVSRPASVLGL
jgi:hypothetical protein